MRGHQSARKYFRVQFGDRNFYDFLLSIGLMPAKSKKLQDLKIPHEYFVDFLRGCFDGDGNINVFNHPESKEPQLRMRLFSASYVFLTWVNEEIQRNIKVEGGTVGKGKGVFGLGYGWRRRS